MNYKIRRCFLLPMVLFICSCENTINDMTDTKCEEREDVKLNSFFLSVDSLNKDYIPYVTRFDIGKWGTRFLSAAVDGCTGIVASAATTPLGGTIIGTAASWAYEEYLTKCLSKNEGRGTSQNGLSYNNNLKINVTPPTTILSGNKENLSFIDSVGYYHNKVLTKLSTSGKLYIDRNGNIDFEELFSDVSTIMNQYGISTENFTKNKQLAFSSAIENFIKTLDPSDENSIEKSFVAFESERIALGLSYKEIHDLKQMCNKITQTVFYLENEETVEYGKKLYNVIEVSNISEKQKQDFKVLDNIIINSKLYWDSIEE